VLGDDSPYFDERDDLLDDQDGCHDVVSCDARILLSLLFVGVSAEVKQHLPTSQLGTPIRTQKPPLTLTSQL